MEYGRSGGNKLEILETEDELKMEKKDAFFGIIVKKRHLGKAGDVH